METFTVPTRMRKSWYLLVILGCNFWVPPSPDVPGAAGMLGQGLWGCRRSGMPWVPWWVPGPGHPAGAAPLVPLVGTGMVASYLARTRGRCLSSPWARCHSRASRSARPPSSPCRSPRRAACPCSGKQQQGTLVPWRATLCHHVLHHPTRLKQGGSFQGTQSKMQPLLSSFPCLWRGQVLSSCFKEFIRNHNSCFSFPILHS